MREEGLIRDDTPRSVWEISSIRVLDNSSHVPPEEWVKINTSFSFEPEFMSVGDIRSAQWVETNAIGNENSFSYTPTVVSGGTQGVTVRLRARGPVAADLPAYTLTGYRLAWRVTSRDAATVYGEGELPLPTLSPADEWAGRLEWPVQVDYRLTLRLLRPTGFVVGETIFSPNP